MIAGEQELGEALFEDREAFATSTRGQTPEVPAEAESRPAWPVPGVGNPALEAPGMGADHGQHEAFVTPLDTRKRK